MRRITGLLFCLCLIMCCGCGKVSNDYFPMEVGTSWKYKAAGTSLSGKVEVRATEEEKLDEGKAIIFEVKKESADEVDSELFEKREDGIYSYKRVHPALGFIETNLTPPQLYLKLPLKVGDSWKWEGKMFGMKGSFESAVESKEKVSVGNRSYDCFKVVERGTTSDGRSLTDKRWYAGGVGLVKEESAVVLTNESGEVHTLELLEYKGLEKK
ncbi:MAG: hypothetical protein RDV48_13500 [Candidatus Eremiobacteraeota bacterium]|nr:hypothetical protein [Candidatus Eremiobacteraeota bacterium]